MTAASTEMEEQMVLVKHPPEIQNLWIFFDDFDNASANYPSLYDQLIKNLLIAKDKAGTGVSFVGPAGTAIVPPLNLFDRSVFATVFKN